MKRREKIIIVSIIVLLVIVGIVFAAVKDKSNNTASKGEINITDNQNEDLSNNTEKDTKNNVTDKEEDVKQENSTSNTDINEKPSETGTGEETTTVQETILEIESLSKTMYAVSSANIRNGASMNSGVIGKLSKGQIADITGKSGEWYRINYNNVEGFVHYSLLSDNMQEETDSMANNNPINDSSSGNNMVENNPSDNNMAENNPSDNNMAGDNPSGNNTSANQSGGNNINNQNSGNTQSLSDIDEVIRIVNEERQKNGLQPLKKNNELCNAAATRAEEITVQFSHTRPDGRSFYTILNDLNILYMAAGENIAAGQRTPSDVMNSWMNSQGHRENILSSSFGEIGVGCVRGKGEYGVYWVQIFKD